MTEETWECECCHEESADVRVGPSREPDGEGKITCAACAEMAERVQDRED